jgi:hypothetical protein
MRRGRTALLVGEVDPAHYLFSSVVDRDRGVIGRCVIDDRHIERQSGQNDLTSNARKIMSRQCAVLNAGIIMSRLDILSDASVAQVCCPVFACLFRVNSKLNQ